MATVVRLLRCQPSISHVPNRVAQAAAGLPAVARALLASRGGAPADVLVVRIQGEQAPNPHSRVTSSGTRNRLGIANARLDWRLLPLDTDSIRRCQEILGEELRMAGLGRLEDLFGDERPPASLPASTITSVRQGCTPTRGAVSLTQRAA